MKQHISFFLFVIALIVAACTPYPKYELPKLETQEATNVGSNSAVLHGRVVSLTSDDEKYRVEVGFQLCDDSLFADYPQTLWGDERMVLMTPENMADIHVTATYLVPGLTYYYRVFVKTHYTSIISCNVDEEMSAPIYGNTMSFKTVPYWY